MTLAEVKTKHDVIIKEIAATGAIKDRLIALGLSVGTHLKIIRRSAIGQTLVVGVGASFIALRKEEAKTIIVDSHI